MSIKRKRVFRNLGRLIRPRSAYAALRGLWRSAPDSPAAVLARCQGLLRERKGLEIGGPSGLCTGAGDFPIYPVVGGLDNCNFSDHTTWEGSLCEGLNFRFDDSRPVGHQYIREAVDLHGLESDSYDFVLSCHCLEHIANPLRAMREWMGVLKESGYLVLIVPHKDGTFDHARPITSLAHLADDEQRGVDETDLTHLPEILALHDLSMDRWAGGPENFKNRSLQNYANRCLHHHVFDTRLALQVLDYTGLCILELALLEPHHIVTVAQKLPKNVRANNRAMLDDGAAWVAQSPFPSDRSLRKSAA